MGKTISKETLRTLRDYFASREHELLTFVCALVETESPSGDKEGSSEVVDLIASAAGSIGAVNSVERITAEDFGEHIRIRAFAGYDTASAPVLILGHTDTVHPRGSIRERPWRTEENRIYGPGIFDMKANCALALEILRALETWDLRPVPVTILLTCDEESGSANGRALVEAEAKDARAVLVIEPSASGGRAKTARKGTGMFTVEVEGRAAHAGLDPEKGVSAILELARQTIRLHEFNDPASGTNVTVTIFNGGTFSNVVPAAARAEVDMRFTSLAAGRRVESEVLNLKPFDSRARLTITGGINRPPLERTEKVAGLYQHARQLASLLNFDLGEASVGGGSDGNFAGALDVPVLDGLGIAGDGAHAEHEHIITDDIAARGALLAGLIASL
jgi:glutamate carboxypeptidase